MCTLLSGTFAQTNIVVDFLTDTKSLENFKGNPIIEFQNAAKTLATKTALLTKENSADLLKEAANYKNTVITVGIHTIAKVTELDNKIASGAWATNMPFGEGYVKKGELESREGYINNIIGIPDAQERTIYFFE